MESVLQAKETDFFPTPPPHSFFGTDQSRLTVCIQSLSPHTQDSSSTLLQSENSRRALNRQHTSATPTYFISDHNVLIYIASLYIYSSTLC